MDKKTQDRLLAELMASFPQRPMEAPEQALWRQTFKPLTVAGCSAAIRKLRQEKDWPPTHHEFLQVAQAEGRRLSTRSDGCERCEGGWITVRYPPNTVLPCEGCRPELHSVWTSGGTAPTFGAIDPEPDPAQRAHRKRCLDAAREALGHPVDLEVF